MQREMIFSGPLLALFFLAASPVPGEADVYLVDGDTLDLDGVRMRIDGIDAPEFGQHCGVWACGKAALEELSSLIGSNAVTCDPHGQDGYGRTIATCFVGNTDLGAEMVRTGYARAFVKYSVKYISQEVEARDSNRGIWQYNSQPPWDYRAAKWAAAEQVAPKGCPIKGNISGSGKIYHTPWSPWYGKTSVNEAKGERWFCSEAEAVAAGWRAPRWK